MQIQKYLFSGVVLSVMVAQAQVVTSWQCPMSYKVDGYTQRLSDLKIWSGPLNHLQRQHAIKVNRQQIGLIFEEAYLQWRRPQAEDATQWWMQCIYGGKESESLLIPVDEAQACQMWVLPSSGIVMTRCQREDAR